MPATHTGTASLISGPRDVEYRSRALVEQTCGGDWSRVIAHPGGAYTVANSAEHARAIVGRGPSVEEVAQVDEVVEPAPRRRRRRASSPA